MKNILLLTIILITAKLSFCQERNENSKVPPPLFALISASGDTVKWKGTISLLDPHEIKEMNIWKGEKATAKYGSAGENGVLEIILNEGVEILDLNALKKIYKISQYKKVNIVIDGEISSSLVATKKGIKEINLQVIKENEEININIVSNYPKVKSNAGGDILIQ